MSKYKKVKLLRNSPVPYPTSVIINSWPVLFNLFHLWPYLFLSLLLWIVLNFEFFSALFIFLLLRPFVTNCSKADVFKGSIPCLWNYLTLLSH